LPGLNLPSRQNRDQKRWRSSGGAVIGAFAAAFSETYDRKAIYPIEFAG
jgi:hypothetical protein